MLWIFIAKVGIVIDVTVGVVTVEAMIDLAIETVIVVTVDNYTTGVFAAARP